MAEEQLPEPGSAGARALLERLLLDDTSPRTEGRVRRRLALRVAIVIACAGALTLGALSVLPSGEPEKASAVERAAAAIGAADDGILHVITTGTVTGPDGQVLNSERTEAWQLSSPPYDMRQVIQSDGDTQRELATADGAAEVYDARTNTISSLLPAIELPPPTSRPPLPNADRPVPGDEPLDQSPERLRAQILDLLHSGEAREDGRVNVDGREAIRIVAPSMNMTLLVDAQSYEPIEWSTPVTGIGTDPDRGLLTTRFDTYERLPATEANLALLDLRAQHPDATIDHRITIDRDPPGK